MSDKKSFFISYTGKDVSWATWIAKTLENAGYTTIIQAWDFNKGDNFVDKMDAALKNSERFLAVLSEKYLNSPYCKAEWVAAFAKDINLEKAAFIPVRIENVTPSGIFTDIAYIDLFGLDEDTSIKKLLDGVISSGAKNILGQAGTKKPKFPGDMPLNNLPHSRNPYFTGRDEKLDFTHANFQSGDRVSLTQSVSGLGGVGKTAIALEYAYRYSHEYETIWWINAETSASVLIAYRDFALQKRIVTDDAKSDEVINAMKHWFSNNENWLFIYDNADADDFDKWLGSYLPQNSKGHILVTTRSSNFPRSKSVDIIVFNEAESIIFLKERTQKIGDGYSENLAKTLAERLQYLPLALEQAAAYIVETPNVSYQDYINLLSERGVETFEKDNYLVDYTSIINMTWNISMQKITNEGARQMFNMCAYFAPERIPVDMFVRGSGVLPEPLQSGIVDLLQRNDILRDLTRYSLLILGRNASTSSEEKRVLDMHRLLQEVVQKSFGNNVEWLGYGLDLMRKAIDWKAGDKDSVNLFKIESPHAILITEKSLKVYKEDKQKLDAIAWILNAVGDIDNDLGEYQKALDNQYKAMELWSKIYGKKHSNTATIYNSIGKVHYNLSEYSKALDYYNKAIEIYKKKLGKEHSLVGVTYNNIGKVYIKLGKSLGVRVLYDALKILQNNYGENHPYTATVYMDIGINHIENDFFKTLHSIENMVYTLSESGDSDKGAEYALKNFNKALAIYKNIYEDAHYCTAMSYNYVGKSYIYLKKYDKALDNLEKALNIVNDIYGTEHLYTATIYANLGSLYSHLDKFDNALHYFKKVLEIQKKFFSESDLSIASLYNDMGHFFLKFKMYDKALDCFVKDAENSRKNYDSDVKNKNYEKQYLNNNKEAMRMVGIVNIENAILQKVSIFINLSIVILKNFRLATKLITRLIRFVLSLKKREKKSDDIYFDGLGDDIYSTFNFTDEHSISHNLLKKIWDKYFFIAEMYNKNNEYEKALYYYNQTIEMKHRVGLDDMPTEEDNITLYYKISTIHLKLNNYTEALKYCNKALRIFDFNIILANKQKKKDGDGNNDTEQNKINNEIAGLYNIIGEIYYKQNEYKKALEYFAKAIEIYKKLPHKDESTSEDDINVCDCYAVSATYSNIGKIYKNINDYESALKNYHNAIKFSLIDDKEESQVLYELIEEIVELLKNDVDGKYQNFDTVMIYADECIICLKINKLEKTFDVNITINSVNELEIAEAYDFIGNIYTKIKEQNKANEFYDKALKSYNKAVENNKSSDDYEELIKLHKKILAIKIKKYGEDHADVATSYNRIGLAYSRFGNRKKALEYYNKSLEIRKNVLGEENANTATSYNNVGLIHYKLTEYEKALEYQNKALEIRRKVLGENHTTTAESYEDVGDDYNKLGDIEKALEHYKKAIDIQLKIKDIDNKKILELYEDVLMLQKKIYGEEHIDVASTYNNAGVVYSRLNDSKKALEYYIKASEIRKKTLGEENTLTALSYNNVGVIYYRLREYEKALEYQNKALEIRRKVLGENHITTIESYENVGYDYNKLGDIENALEHYKKAIDIRLKLNNKEHEKMLELHKQLLILQQKKYGEEHIETAATHSTIGGIFLKLKDPNNALVHATKALEIRKKIFGEENVLTATSYENISIVHYRLRNYAKSLEYNNIGLTIREKLGERDTPNIATTYYFIGLTYKDLGEFDRALEYFNKALDIRKKIFTEDNPNIKMIRDNIKTVIEQQNNRINQEALHNEQPNEQKIFFHKLHPKRQ